MVSVDELRLDVEELRALSEKALRSNVKEILLTQSNRVQSQVDEIVRLEKVKRENAEKRAAAASNAASGQLPVVKITNYGWDQSDKFVKIYITLNGVQNVLESDIVPEFTANSFSVTVTNFAGKNHQLVMKDLLFNIDTEKSQVKKKTDMVLVMLKKEKEGQNWDEITKLQKAEKDKKMPKFDDKQDPQAAMMDMMKKMYEDGDDETKRSIRKAWHEGQNKQQMPAMPEL